jgi:RAD51-like protein 1
MTVCSSAIVQGSSAVYIDTEAAFTAQRFLEIATHRWSTPNLVDVLSRNFHIFTELTCSDLHQRLSTLEEFLVEHNVKLIVVDSIASLLRKEFESSTAKSVSERTSALTSLANTLKYLAQVYRLAILVVNQVTTRIVSYHMEHTVEEDEEGSDVEQEAAIVTVALGNTWAHTVNSRLVMEYLTADLRKMSIVKCPLAPCVSLACRIQLKGVVVDWQATGDLESGKEGVGYGGLTVQSDVSDQIQWTSDLLH